jgi:hypothetical protein
LEKALLAHAFANTAYSQAATVYLALFSGTTADDGSATEISGNAYARQAIAFANGATSPAGTISNTALVQFPVANPAAWNTITSFGIYDTSAAGNLLVHGALTAAKNVGAGDRIEFATASVVITFA